MKLFFIYDNNFRKIHEIISTGNLPNSVTSRGGTSTDSIYQVVTTLHTDTQVQTDSPTAEKQPLRIYDSVLERLEKINCLQDLIQ